MKTINFVPPGLFLGNTLFSYAHARGYAERHGYRLHVAPWIGQKIFQLDDPGIEQNFTRRTEFTVNDGESDIEFYTYAQSQDALTYTRSQAREWFKFRPEVWYELNQYTPKLMAAGAEWIAHRRVGDYPGYGYVVPSVDSYLRFCVLKGVSVHSLRWITEENPNLLPVFEGALKMLPDFWVMMNAANLIRGNSTFSWWAHVLAVNQAQRVFSPVIEGLEGGTEERSVNFVEGNHPRFANLGFVTDLHLAP